MLVVLDTNILVSALWSPKGAPAAVVEMVLKGELTPCYDERILGEYEEVLTRKKFGFAADEVRTLIEGLEAQGRWVVPEVVEGEFVDVADKKFYEVAKAGQAILVTGNTRHFPHDASVMTVNELLALHVLDAEIRMVKLAVGENDGAVGMRDGSGAVGAMGDSGVVGA